MAACRGPHQPNDPHHPNPLRGLLPRLSAARTYPEPCRTPQGPPPSGRRLIPSDLIAGKAHLGVVFYAVRQVSITGVVWRLTDCSLLFHTSPSPPPPLPLTKEPKACNKALTLWDPQVLLCHPEGGARWTASFQGAAGCPVGEQPSSPNPVLSNVCSANHQGMVLAFLRPQRLRSGRRDQRPGPSPQHQESSTLSKHRTLGSAGL